MQTSTPAIFAAPRVSATRRDDGALLLRSSDALGDYPRSIAHLFRENAARHPDRVLATRGGQQLSWGDARTAADSIAQALLDRGLGPDRPAMILSGNSLEHLQLMLGAFVAGVPVLPISTAYSLMSRDHQRIRATADLCAPGLVYADDGELFGPALEALPAGCETQVGLSELTAVTRTDQVERALDAVGPDTVAKILFTSGSTGTPKGVINTHRMLCSNQQALGQVWPVLHEDAPVLVDWLPWSHTFGGNHNLNQVLAFGGTLHIDDGKPVPQLFDRTVAALREFAPTVYYNVPAGYALLAPVLEDDPAFAAHFFSRLRFMFYAAAALPQSLWDRMRAIADASGAQDVPLTASWGTTETAPAATTAHFTSARCGCIGVPLPGVTLKLVPYGDKTEIRVSGPNITPGYHRNLEATAAAFDDEGFYRPGDAVRLVDESDPAQGLLFDGRLAEDFKLASGTFVRVGELRLRLIAEAGVLTDAVIAGHDRDHVRALAWVNAAQGRSVLGRDGDVALDDPALRAHLADALARVNDGRGTAACVEGLLLLEEPPNIDAGEITDKGYINQRAVLQRRADLVERLYAEPPDADVIRAKG